MMASMVGTGGGVRGGVIKNAGVTVGVRGSGGAVGKSGTVNFPWLAVVGVELAACERADVILKKARWRCRHRLR